MPSLFRRLETDKDSIRRKVEVMKKKYAATISRMEEELASENSFLPRLCSRALMACLLACLLRPPFYIDGLLASYPPLEGGAKRNDPPVTSRCGSLLPSAPADVRSFDDVVAF